VLDQTPRVGAVEPDPLAEKARLRMLK